MSTKLEAKCFDESLNFKQVHDKNITLFSLVQVHFTPLGLVGTLRGSQSGWIL